MEPGASRPKPGGDPSTPMDDAEVEKTLTSLESITSTLVQEVGTPPNRTAKAEAQAAATAAPPAAAASEVEDAASPARRQSQAAPDATDVTTPDMPSQNAAAAPAETTEAAQAVRDPQPESSTPADPADTGQPALEESEPSATEPDSKAAAPVAPESARDESRPNSAASADAEVEQEISQAIQQLQSGQPSAARASAAPVEATSAKPPIVRRILRGLPRAVDGILAPVSLLALLLDLPFRWMPIAVKHLLGYVAVATALMAGALWYYIIAVRTH